MYPMSQIGHVGIPGVHGRVVNGAICQRLAVQKAPTNVNQAVDESRLHGPLHLVRYVRAQGPGVFLVVVDLYLLVGTTFIATV